MSERKFLNSVLMQRGQGYTVEPPNMGHFGGKNVVPCREVVPISDVKNILSN